VALIGGDAGSVTRLDEARAMLVPVANSIPMLDSSAELPVGVGAGGRAVAERRAVVLNDYQRETNGVSPGGPLGVQAAVGVPILHEGRALGALVVVSVSSRGQFGEPDVEALELLAAEAASALVGMERARLSGALLAARTAAHHINNQLALTVGYAELLARHPKLPAELKRMADEALRGAQEAADTLHRMLRIARLEEAEGPDAPQTLEPILDLERSSPGAQ
jgi:GAF domain-containing protein